MTQDSRAAFDDWCISKIGRGYDAFQVWQASRSQVIAELKSDELVEVVANMFGIDLSEGKAAIAAIINQIKEG